MSNSVSDQKSPDSIVTNASWLWEWTFLFLLFYRRACFYNSGSSTGGEVWRWDPERSLRLKRPSWRGERSTNESRGGGVWARRCSSSVEFHLISPAGRGGGGGRRGRLSDVIALCFQTLPLTPLCCWSTRAAPLSSWRGRCGASQKYRPVPC